MSNMESTWTIIVTDGAVVVVDGQEPKSRLKYYAEGLRIYLKGAVKISRRDIVNYHAFEVCQSCHIPVRNLKSESWV